MLNIPLEMLSTGNIFMSKDSAVVDTSSSTRYIYGIFASQLIRYARVCWKYADFLFRRSILFQIISNFRILLGHQVVGKSEQLSL